MTTEQSLKEEIDLFMAGNKTTMRVRELCPVLKNWRNAKQLSDRIPPLVNALHDKHSKSKCVSIYCFHFKHILLLIAIPFVMAMKTNLIMLASKLLLKLAFSMRTVETSEEN